MNLQDLRYVVALAETCHFARAANTCHVSQPTLSTQVKKLEEELGVVLFERTNTYEDPDCQETHYPYERVFCFFSAFQGLALSTVGLIR